MQRWVSRTALVGLVSAAALLAACGGGDDTGTGPTLATVNGQPIKESLLTEQLREIPAEMMQGREAEVRRQLLDRLVEQQLVLQAAKQAKVTDLADYQEQLRTITNQLKANFVLANHISTTLNDQRLMQEYEQRKAQLAFPAVKAKHILVPTRAEAEALIKIANPGNFASLAQQHSKGPSAQQGGELGWFRREAMIPAFANIAFATPLGTVAPQAVETQFGWHVILVEDRNEQYVPPFEQVRDMLRQELAQGEVQTYLASLRQNATITYADGMAPVSPTTAQ